MASDIQNNLLFAHKTDIERYRRILQTYLTAGERVFCGTSSQRRTIGF